MEGLLPSKGRGEWGDEMGEGEVCKGEGGEDKKREGVGVGRANVDKVDSQRRGDVVGWQSDVGPILREGRI